MEAHIPTLFLAIISTGAALTISVGSVAFRHNRDGLAYCAVALALHSTAFFLFSLRGQIGSVASIVFANTLLSGAYAMFAEAIYQFQQRRPPRPLVWLPVLAITVLFALLIDDHAARVIVASLNYSAQCLILLVPVLQRRRQTVGRGQHFLAAGLALLLPMLALRALAAATGMIEMHSLADSNSVQVGTFLASLISLVLMSLGFVLMTKERTDAHNQVLAIRDELTGLANRRRLNEFLAAEWARASRSGHPLALVMLDVDLFKKYNDRYGHQAGDECLAQVARVLQSGAQRAGDLAARYGGEEFVLVLTNTDAHAAKRMAESLLQGIAALGLPHELSPIGKVTLSAGVAALTDGCYEDVEVLLRAADDALYRAKQGGRNQVHLAPHPSGGTGTLHFVRLVWHASYESGNRTIDAQHRRLFEHANNLLAAILAGRPAQDVSALIDALILDVVQHFNDEEAILKTTSFAGTQEHAATHRELVSRAGDLLHRFNDGKLGVGEVFQFLAHDVVARHMLGADRKFFPYLPAQR